MALLLEMHISEHHLPILVWKCEVCAYQHGSWNWLIIWRWCDHLSVSFILWVTSVHLQFFMCCTQSWVNHPAKSLKCDWRLLWYKLLNMATCSYCTLPMMSFCFSLQYSEHYLSGCLHYLLNRRNLIFELGLSMKYSLSIRINSLACKWRVEGAL